MAHDVFHMAFVGEEPWHGLGTRIPPTTPATKVMEAAKLNWKVWKTPAQGARVIRNSPLVTYDRYIISRDPIVGETEPVALAIVGPEYEPLQNDEAFQFFEPFIDRKWATFHTAGALGNGERVWVLARLPEKMTIGKDDPIDRFLLLATSHDGRSAVTVRFTGIRVVCQNTLALAERGGKGVISIRHTRHMKRNLMRAQADEIKAVSAKVFGDAERWFGRMADRHMRPQEVDAYLQSLYPRTKKQKANGEEPVRWRRVRNVLNDVGVTPPKTSGTLWAIYNAVVREEDYRATREQTAEARLARVWFGRGRDLKLKALEEALALLRN